MCAAVFSVMLRHVRHFARSSADFTRNLSSRISALSVSRRTRNSPVMAAIASQTAVQTFDYFLVLDFEATCDRDTKLEPQEIIEFPVLKVNGKTFETEAEFHQYVQPEVHKQLTQFCTELFDSWMNDQGLLRPGVQSIFVTCGDWDLQTMLPQQCRHFDIQLPAYFKRWINIKKPFCDVTGTYPKGMVSMLRLLSLPHVGRHHSGIDDCRNIANILSALAGKHYIFKATKQLTQ